ncbi:hypothetical protein GCM10010339_92730 [Streptomyces alanosinicus]|uniref:Uncharacterized protein n=1 Tax=Streptomyces alanosinicus TaxID=68171 RepID=A0A918YTZ0_9ACTN|nr:hypothetical protein GCM10010339_92730 [Streptomyces alanosinicus]
MACPTGAVDAGHEGRAYAVPEQEIGVTRWQGCPPLFSDAELVCLAAYGKPWGTGLRLPRKA